MKGKITIDHLDFNKLNNDPSNLRLACMKCNNRRANGVSRSEIGLRLYANYQRIPATCSDCGRSCISEMGLRGHSGHCSVRKARLLKIHDPASVAEMALAADL
jgi:hypothetical protein